MSDSDEVQACGPGVEVDASGRALEPFADVLARARKELDAGCPCGVPWKKHYRAGRFIACRGKCSKDVL